MLCDPVNDLPLFRIHIGVQLILLFQHHASCAPLMKLPQKLSHKFLIKKIIRQDDISIQIRPDRQVIDLLFTTDMVDIKRIPHLRIGLLWIGGTGEHYHIISGCPGCPVNAVQRIHDQRMGNRRCDHSNFSYCMHSFLRASLPSYTIIYSIQFSARNVK